MMPAASSAGQPASSSREGAGNPKVDNEGGRIVRAQPVDPTAAARDSECTYETESSDPTDAEIDAAANITEDMDLPPGTTVSCSCTGVGWRSSVVSNTLDNGRYDLDCKKRTQDQGHGALQAKIPDSARQDIIPRCGGTCRILQRGCTR
eukprot:6804040-Pyramimonas_sp.AAC.1